MAVQELNLQPAAPSEMAQAEILGPLNRDTIPALQQRLEGVHDSCITLDLRAADYQDSDGIRWLQQLQAQLTDRHVELRLRVQEGSRADRTLKLLRLDTCFVIERPSSHA
jgi:anti-anti-sigma regulatory factor